jgi:hypothetical protein
MQLQLGELSLQAEQEAAIGRAGVVDAVPVGNQALLVAAQIEQRVPVGAVAG